MLSTLFVAGALGMCQTSRAVDRPLPALLFPELGTGELRDLRDFRGGKVLLFQFASW